MLALCVFFLVACLRLVQRWCSGQGDVPTVHVLILLLARATSACYAKLLIFHAFHGVMRSFTYVPMVV